MERKKILTEWRCRKWAAAMLAAMISLTATAQNDEFGFSADRPGATTGTDVVEKGRLQWETGVGYERSRLEETASTTWMLNETLLRWGISKQAELRLQADYLTCSMEGYHVNGLANVAVGTKVRLYDGWKAMPAVALLGNVVIPGGSSAEFMPEEWGAQMGLLFQNELASWLTLNYEADLVWLDSAKPIAFWGACLTFQLNDKLALMAEQYNYNSTYGHQNWLELGASYMLTPRLQADIATDISLNYTKRYFNLLVGVAWQITK